MNYGMKIRIRTKTFETIFRNVTEIHYNYEFLKPGDVRLAFESKIHIAGISFSMNDVLEFETDIETEIAEEF